MTTMYNEVRIPGKIRNTETINSTVSRVETEISIGWAAENPELFVEAVAAHLRSAVEHNLQKQTFDGFRHGFITLVSEIA